MPGSNADESVPSKLSDVFVPWIPVGAVNEAVGAVSTVMSWLTWTCWPRLLVIVSVTVYAPRAKVCVVIGFAPASTGWGGL